MLYRSIYLKYALLLRGGNTAMGAKILSGADAESRARGKLISVSALVWLESDIPDRTPKVRVQHVQRGLRGVRDIRNERTMLNGEGNLVAGLDVDRFLGWEFGIPGGAVTHTSRCSTVLSGSVYDSDSQLMRIRKEDLDGINCFDVKGRILWLGTHPVFLRAQFIEKSNLTNLCELRNENIPKLSCRENGLLKIGQAINGHRDFKSGSGFCPVVELEQLIRLLRGAIDEYISYRRAPNAPPSGSAADSHEIGRLVGKIDLTGAGTEQARSGRLAKIKTFAEREGMVIEGIDEPSRPGGQPPHVDVLLEFREAIEKEIQAAVADPLKGDYCPKHITDAVADKFVIRPPPANIDGAYDLYKPFSTDN